MATSLTVNRENQVVTATINRPDKMNAMSKEVYDELTRLVDVLETDKTARALIVTGTGDKAFSVGADLKERQGMNEKDILVRLEFVRKLYQRLERLPMLVIGAVNGLALGGGTELALACDLRVASATATFGLPEVDLAIIPGTGGTQRLPRIIGMGRALEWILLAKRVSAAEAWTVGLVNEVVPPDQLLPKAREWAKKVLDAGPIAIRQAKLAIRDGMDKPLDAGLKIEIEAYRACLYSQDRLEGLKAFGEKRRPNFTGV